MAKRYSGKVSVRLSYNDNTQQYDCVVKEAGQAPIKIHVRPPACLEKAVDSPEEYDGAARAAIAFAEHENGSFDGVALDDSGIYVGRSPAKAWPSAVVLPFKPCKPCKPTGLRGLMR